MVNLYLEIIEGGLFCCQDNLQCKLRKDFDAPKRKLSLRYKIRWVDWDEHQVPLKFYILDATDKVRSNGSTSIHYCQAEYTIPRIGDSDSLHVKKENILIEKGGYLIYGTSHMHIGVVNTTLYGQDGRVLCTSTPKYGTRKEAGNEKGYVVRMSGCYLKPGSINIKDGSLCGVRKASAPEKAVKGETTNVLPEQAIPIVLVEENPSKKVTKVVQNNR
ncbi:hypothetical protein Fmac_026193 [Flemingia macrophylla]|uniref:Uncharacterized protein n=1 Tax=Flemingia macrophylla TaxID=520843 RepID=A0ABD1LE58_9FABA